MLLSSFSDVCDFQNPIAVWQRSTFISFCKIRPRSCSFGGSRSLWEKNVLHIHRFGCTNKYFWTITFEDNKFGKYFLTHVLHRIGIARTNILTGIINYHICDIFLDIFFIYLMEKPVVKQCLAKMSAKTLKHNMKVLSSFQCFWLYMTDDVKPHNLHCWNGWRLWSPGLTLHRRP